MKLELTQENINKALTIVGHIVGSRGSLPVLSNVLLQTDSNRLRLSTTNLEVGISTWVGAKVDDQGSITVPARLISEYVSNLPSGNIAIGLNKSSLNIKTGSYTSTINGIPAEEFPSIPKIEGNPSLSIPAADFKAAISQVVSVASSDDARPVLTGIYIFTEDKTLYLAATDSYRLAEKKLTLKKATDLKIIVPARTISELLRIIEDGTEDTLDILVDENQVCFRLPDTELVSRLIDGQFPDYRQLIPSEIQTNVLISTKEFTNITKLAGLFARENAGSVTVAVEDGAFSMRSIASQVGENTSKAEAQVEGDDIEVSLNSRYIIDALGVVNSDQVSFGLTGKVNPCVLRPTNTEDYLHIIMPLRS